MLFLSISLSPVPRTELTEATSALCLSAVASLYSQCDKEKIDNEIKREISAGRRNERRKTFLTPLLSEAVVDRITSDSELTLREEKLGLRAIVCLHFVVLFVIPAPLAWDQ